MERCLLMNEKDFRQNAQPQRLQQRDTRGLSQIPPLRYRYGNENVPNISAMDMAVLHQQFRLAQAIEEWIGALRKELV